MHHSTFVAFLIATALPAIISATSAPTQEHGDGVAKREPQGTFYSDYNLKARGDTFVNAEIGSQNRRRQVPDEMTPEDLASIIAAAASEAESTDATRLARRHGKGRGGGRWRGGRKWRVHGGWHHGKGKKKHGQHASGIDVASTAIPTPTAVEPEATAAAETQILATATTEVATAVETQAAAAATVVPTDSSTETETESGGETQAGDERADLQVEPVERRHVPGPDSGRVPVRFHRRPFHHGGQRPDWTKGKNKGHPHPSKPSVLPAPVFSSPPFMPTVEPRPSTLPAVVKTEEVDE